MVSVTKRRHPLRSEPDLLGFGQIGAKLLRSSSLQIHRERRRRTGSRSDHYSVGSWQVASADTVVTPGYPTALRADGRNWRFTDNRQVSRCIANLRTRLRARKHYRQMAQATEPTRRGPGRPRKTEVAPVVETTVDNDYDGFEVGDTILISRKGEITLGTIAHVVTGNGTTIAVVKANN